MSRRPSGPSSLTPPTTRAPRTAPPAPPPRYYTSADDDLPVEQGEGCQVWPRTSSCASGGTYLFHEYNRSAWIEAPIDADVFAIPDVCTGLSSADTCMYP